MVSQYLEFVMTTKQKIVSLMDLTQLGESDTDADIVKLCAKAKNSLGEVTAICVYKQFVPVVKKTLGSDFKVATVINFPKGNSSVEDIVLEAKEAVSLGADEIDLVIDYNEYIQKGHSQKSCDMIEKVKNVCQDRVLKVIIESGELEDNLISKASHDAIVNGADFVKTSTGKTPNGASLGAAKVILETIKNSGYEVGFKASGGIREEAQALGYIKLAEEIMSKKYVVADSFRFGVSGLLDNLLNGEVSSGY
ncbi:deoxyribose-phosphate aldolase [Francisella sp. SYW-2]|uniref:deoxyribose-phosphate aldolase n=1 Tax=Francisella sp. SYW-2 TaxID=2610886 RepID=UPI00168D8CA3|nr:deoxyribose-phosphate aldolase [Francisella sp. SYW-2]